MSSLRLHRLLIAASLIVPVGLFSAAAVHNRADVLREGQEAVTRTVAVMHEHARKVFETGDLALGRVNDHIEGMSWEEISAPETSVFLARLKAPLEQAVSIWVTDANGVVRAGSQPWNPAVTIGEREFFQAQRERDAGTYVSAAFRGLATNTASFAVSRRRTARDGRFDGTVHISLSPEYFARFFAQAAPDLPHAGALLRSDGVILAREPYREVNAPLTSDSPLMRQIAVQPDGGFSFGRSTLDSAERAYGYRKVAGYPLYVGFGVETGALLRRWHENLVLFGMVAGAASLMLLLVSWLALRGVKAERSVMTRLQAALDSLQLETAQREAAEQRVRQAQKMEAVGQLTGGIAHDFNNLLTAVLGSLELLRKRIPASDGGALRLLDNAVKGAQRGALLTQRLLAFSRNQTLQPKPVEVPELIRDMADLLQSSVGAGVQIETSVPHGLPLALVDANQLELALLNLAVNARDAMAGAGRLTITARAERVEAGQDSELPPGGYVVLAVADTGEGMDEATLARCVEPFFTTKGIGKGTGLGLSMVHGFTAQSGGRLVLRSRKDEGTTAELWLSQAKAAQAAASIPGVAGVERSPHRRCTVLLVDDDPLVLSSAASILEELGHSVREAGSGCQALEMVNAGPDVELVITDHAMPGMTGLQLVAELRRCKPGLPVLLATGFADRERLATAGVLLLAKPFGVAELAAAVEGCLSVAALR